MAMKNRTGCCLIFVAFALPPATLKAGDVDQRSLTFAAAQSSKSKHINVCRARYHDCLNKNQIPSFECQYIYQDCINRVY
jgi:hypothetical protein